MRNILHKILGNTKTQMLYSIFFNGAICDLRKNVVQLHRP